MFYLLPYSIALPYWYINSLLQSYAGLLLSKSVVLPSRFLPQILSILGILWDPNYYALLYLILSILYKNPIFLQIWEFGWSFILVRRVKNS